MAYSKITYTYSGGAKIFSIPFPYIKDSDIYVFVNNTSITNFTINNKEVTINDSLSSGASVTLIRFTNRESLEVRFADSGGLKLEDLDISSQQNFYIMQESIDDLQTTMGQAPDGSWNAEGKVIKNGSYGTAPTDLACVGQLSSFVDECDSLLTETTNKATEASVSADSALLSAEASAESASEAAEYASSASLITTINIVTASEEDAENSAMSAAISETNAKTSEVNAASSASSALVSKQSAEASADAAQLSADIYDTTTLGLAATTNGQYFSVPSSASAEYLILYKNVSGVATEIKRYPSSVPFDYIKQYQSDLIFGVADNNGKVGFAVDRKGNIKTDVLQTKQSLQYKCCFADKAGNVLFGIDNNGKIIPSQEPLKSNGVYDFDINHVIGYGQSLSVGYVGYPALTTSQKYDNLMFYRGQVPQLDYPSENASQWYLSLVPAVESNGVTGSTDATQRGETTSSGCGDMIKERILVEDGKSYSDHNYKILTSCAGYGGMSISQLSKGTSHYNRMIEQAQYGLTLSNAAGKNYAVQAVSWTQGEADYSLGTTKVNYLNALNQLVTDINTDIKAAIAQTKDIPLISYQIASHPVASVTNPVIALAQLEAEETNPLVFIATPTYHLPYANPNNWHLTNVGLRWLGAYYGLAYKRIVIDGEDWKPLKPISAKKQSNILDITFNVPHGKLEFDTTQVSANTNMGFELVDSSGNALTIDSVAIADSNRVRIIATSNIPTGAKVRYGWSGTATTGPISGARGNLRDTQGDEIVLDSSGINKRMDNWCVIFEREV